MDLKVIWNDLCYGLKEERIKKAEVFVQIFVEGIFGRLGWSLSEKEILSMKKIKEGKKPDIIIIKNKDRAFVVELKKPDVDINDHVNQLLHYMREEKINIGILLGDKLMTYYKLPGDNDQFCKINDFNLVKDCSEGIELLKFLSKDDFSLDLLMKYCEERRVNDNILQEGESNEHEDETMYKRLRKIETYLRDKDTKRKGIHFKMGHVKKDSLLGYEVNQQGFEIKIKPKKSEIKLWDNSKPKDWYEKELKNLKECLFGFNIEQSEIVYTPNKRNKNKGGFYIPLDKFFETKDNPPTPENILDILTEVNKVMKYVTD